MDELSDDFGRGGFALWRSLHSEDNDAALTALVVEACRAKDRLDRLSRITGGDEDSWCRVFRGGEGDGELILKLDTAVSEQRQLSTVFRQLLAEIQRRQGERNAVDEEDGLAGL